MLLFVFYFDCYLFFQMLLMYPGSLYYNRKQVDVLTTAGIIFVYRHFSVANWYFDFFF